MQVVLLTGSGSEVLSEDTVLSTSGGYSYLAKNYFAFTVDDNRPMCLVENRTSSERTLGPPLVTNYDSLSLSYVEEFIVPACKRILFRQPAEDSGTEEDAESEKEKRWHARVSVDQKMVDFPEDGQQVGSIDRRCDALSLGIALSRGHQFAGSYRLDMGITNATADGRCGESRLPHEALVIAKVTGPEERVLQIPNFSPKDV